MSIYFIPALVALLVKLFVLAYVLKGGKVSIVFLSLIVVFAAHNAIEVFGYISFSNNSDNVGVFFQLYYVATAYVIMYIMLHSLAITKLEHTFSTGILITLTTALSGLMLFSNSVIAGQYSIGYSMTAVKGTYYWLFASHLLIILIASLAVLVYGYRKATSHIDSVRCLHSLFALAPIILVFVVAVIFKIADIGINATGLVPIATTLFLGIVLKTEATHKLSDLRRLMPLSLERETTNNLMDLLDNYMQNSNKENVYKELQDGIERQIISYSLQKCDNNVSKTTRMMGLKNRSTFYSMVKRLEIDLNEAKLKNSK